MSHIDIDKTVQTLVDNTSQLLSAHGYQIVTEDKKLFPYVTPALAALKDGRLLVFAVWVFPIKGEFEEDIVDIQNYFYEAVDENTPDSDPRVQYYEKVAIIMAPENIEDKAPAGDIHWIGIQSPAELADKLRQSLAL